MPNDKDIVIKRCIDCGATIYTNHGYDRKVPADHHWRCKACMSKYRSQMQKKSATNIGSIVAKKMNDPDECNAYRRMLSDRAKAAWNNKSDTERNAWKQKFHRGTMKYYREVPKEILVNRGKRLSVYNSAKSDDLKKIHYGRISKSRKLYFQNLSDEERKIFCKIYKDAWDKKSDEDKDSHRQRSINQWNSYSSDKRKEQIDLLRKNGTDRWKNADEQYRINFGRKISDAYNSLDDESKQRISRIHRERWEQMSDIDKYNQLMKSINKSRSINSLHTKFEDGFNSSYVSNKLYYVRENVVSNQTTHSWDYGIYSKDTNELVMVVDLDGAYYHADTTDYDGLHSHVEYDESRPLTIPDGIKYAIITEKGFSKSFDKMVKLLIVDYNEFVDQLFRECRSMPFPEPHYTDTELMKSYDQLVKMNCNDKYHQDISLNNREGDRLINHFHHSIYHAHRKNKPSPYDAWNDDKLLHKCIENRIIYQSYLNPNKILQGFNVSKIAPKVSVFSAGRAKMIINRYLSEYDEIFDPFSGFSGRMLGAMSIGKKYIGQDISEIHVIEGNNMIEFLKDHGIRFDTTITQQDILQSSGEYECLFTCPPYSDKEIWKGEICDKRTCDDWIDECLNRFKCKKYLFVVDYTEKYKEYVVDIIVNRSHLSRNQEYIILI